MKRANRVKTAAEVRAEFKRIGKPLNHWALERGYQPSLVYEVLRGRIRANFGKSHEIAVLLGMKEGEIERRQAA